MLMRGFLIICFPTLLLGLSCGPDLDPQKYLVKSVLLASYEEYYFQYQNDGRLLKLTGTDSTTLSYSYFRDSTTILQTNKSGALNLRTQLAYSGDELVKVKVQWKFGPNWYKDSILFNYSGKNLLSITYKKVSYQATMQNGNLTNFNRGANVLSTAYTFTYDQLTNPLSSVYWLTPFILPSGTTTIIQPNAIARYFSKNNVKTTVFAILGTATTERYSYKYLHDILPKSINYEVQTAKKVERFTYLFDIQYIAKGVASY
jgi:hypothetical protein